MITNPASGQGFLEPADILIQAQADGGTGTVQQISFFANSSTLLGDVMSLPYAVTWSNVTAGSYTLTGIMSNSLGQVVTSAVAYISVADTNAPAADETGLRLQYKAADTNPDNNAIKPHITLFNDGTNAIAWSDVTIRYWYTKDGSESQNYYCDYSELGSDNINSSFVTPVPTGVTADCYLELSFETGAGELAADGGNALIQNRIHKANWANYDESNDYSFDGNITDYSDYTNITVYYQGALAWGKEPAGMTLPVLSITVIDTNACEYEAESGSFSIQSTQTATENLVLHFSISGTASNGTDFTWLTNTVELALGSNAVTLLITPIEDTQVEGSETVIINLTEHADYDVGRPDQAVLVLRDQPVDQWRLDVFSAEDATNNTVAGDMADPDGDKIQNLMEYALLLDPMSNNTEIIFFGSVDLMSTGTYFSAHYTRRAGLLDVRCLVERSDNLTTWATNNIFQEADITPTNNTEHIKATFPADSVSQQFLRLNVSRP